MKSEVTLNKDSLGKSNFIEFLKSFSKDEIREFEKFINSPFHNNRNDVIKYYAVLKKFYPSFDKKNFSREFIFQEIYPGEKYNDSVIRVLSSLLMSLCEKYVIYKRNNSDEFYSRKQYLQELNERKLEKIFIKVLKETEKKLEEDQKRNREYFLKKYELSAIKDESIMNMFHHKSKIYPDLVKHESIFLEYFQMQILHSYLKIKSDSDYFKNQTNPDVIVNLIEYFEKNFNKTNPVIRIYQLNKKLIDEPDNIELFFILHDELIKNRNLFDKNEFREFHIRLSNYCDEKIFAGKNEFKSIKFDIFKEKLKYNLHLNERGEFLDFSFIRYIETALVNRDFEWAENFIHKYGSLLKSDDKDNILNYAWATVECVRRNFDKCLVYLAKTNFHDIIEKLQIKMLYLRCYYETKGFNEALSLINSVRNTINSEKEADIKQLGTHMKLCYLNFFNNIEKVIKINLKESKLEPGQLKDKIMKVEKIFDRNWLIRKIDEIEANVI